LTPTEADAIRRIVRKHFGKDASVLLFGSRVADDKRGGDIDLLVESDLLIDERFRRKLEALTELQLTLGDQKIDMVTILPGGAEEELPVVREARIHGIRL
jgi:predicted nucleotidyltransferase